MDDMAYLAAGLRVFLLVAVPVTLAVYACVAAGAASEREQTPEIKKHRKE